MGRRTAEGGRAQSQERERDLLQLSARSSVASSVAVPAVVSCGGSSASSLIFEQFTEQLADLAFSLAQGLAALCSCFVEATGMPAIPLFE